MRVTQTAKTINSITITVEGIGGGDRQTSISLFPNYETGSYYTLSEAQQLGYVTDYYASNVDYNNGNITIVFSDGYLAKHRVCKISVVNTYNGVPYGEVVLPCSVGFEFEKASTKVVGNEIDITVKDIVNINRFHNESCAANTKTYPAYDSSLENKMPGDYIYKEYLTLPINNLLNCIAEYGFTESAFDSIRTLININDELSGSDSFKAEYFNNIKQAINGYYLTNTN